MRKIIVLLLINLIFSCSKKSKDFTKIIDNGMKYEEVVKIMGQPTDSFKYVNADKQLIYLLRYKNEKTKNFSDYGFNIVFNDSLKVINTNYD